MKKTLLGTLFAGMLAGATSANATLIVGSEVDVTFDPLIFGQTVTVADGVDIQLLNFQIDLNHGVGGDVLLWESLPAAGHLAGATGMTLSGLQFAGSVTLTGFELIGTVLSGLTFATTPDSLTFNWTTEPDAFVGPGTVLTGRYLTGALTIPIPEPGTLALTALGLAGIGFSRRKQRTKTVRSHSVTNDGRQPRSTSL